MSVKSIKLLPILLVLGLTTILGACAGTEEVTTPEDGTTQEGVVAPDGTANPTETE